MSKKDRYIFNYDMNEELSEEERELMSKIVGMYRNREHSILSIAAELNLSSTTVKTFLFAYRVSHSKYKEIESLWLKSNKLKEENEKLKKQVRELSARKKFLGIF